MIKNTKILAYIKLTVVILVWGSVYHVAKFLVMETDVYTVAFLRFISAALVLLGLYYRQNRHFNLVRPRHHWWLLFWIGVVGVFGYNVLFFTAETLILANNVAILYAITPCIIILLGKIFLKNSVSILSYLGIIIALLGTIGVIIISEPSCQGKFLCKSLLTTLSLGQMVALGASFAMATYSVLNKKASHINLDPLCITTFSTVFGTLCLFITFLLFGDPVSNLLHKSWIFWLSLFYVSIFATVIGYKWYADAIHNLGVGQTAVFLNGVPLSAILIGVILLQQKMSPSMTILGMIVILGVVITNYAENKTQK